MKLIYAIQHDVTKRIYIGCTQNNSRVGKHLGNLRCGRHIVPLMQSDCDQYGFHFTARMIEVVEDEDASSREKYWIHYFETCYPHKGYNYRDPKARKIPIEEFPEFDGIWLGEKTENLKYPNIK